MIENDEDVTKAVTTKVTDMNNILGANKKDFNQDISSWDVSNVTNMNYAFDDAPYFNQDISNWDVSSVTAMYALFRSTTFNQDISNWDVSNVNNMGNMFTFATAFNQPIGDWDVSGAYSMKRMFWGATSFNQDLSSWSGSVDNVNNCEDFDRDTPQWTRRLESQDNLYNNPYSFPVRFDVINSDRVCEWVSTAVFPVSVVIDTV